MGSAYSLICFVACCNFSESNRLTNHLPRLCLPSPSVSGWCISRRAQGGFDCGVHARMSASSTNPHTEVYDTDAGNQQEIVPLLDNLRIEPQPYSPPQQGRAAAWRTLAYILITVGLCALSSIGTRIYITRPRPHIPTGPDLLPTPLRAGNGTNVWPSQPASTQSLEPNPEIPKLEKGPAGIMDDIYTKQARGDAPNVGWFPSAECEEILVLNEPTIGQVRMVEQPNPTQNKYINIYQYISDTFR